jgi:uncharacterized protein YaaR (DUF327 family)
MAKIDIPGGLKAFLHPAAYGGAVKPEAKKTKQNRAGTAPRKTSFSRVLEGRMRETEAPAPLPLDREALQTLLDEVHSAGDALKHRPFPNEIKRYKQAVSDFLRHVVENSYALTEQTSGINLLKRKKYTLIQVLDHKLEQLAAGILAGQTAQIELLARIDEISGLLVDLLE